MNDLELKKIALRMVEKGYIDRDVVRYSDDLYHATEEEAEKCLDYLDDVVESGTAVFRANLEI